MIRIDFLLVLTAIFQVITTQGPPGGLPNPKCAGPPPGVQNPESCCPVPHLFTEDELAECGFQKLEPNVRRKQGPPAGPPNCSKQECLLQKKNFLADDKSIKYDEVSKYLEGLVDSNPEFKEPIQHSTVTCLGEGGPPGHPKICEADRLMFCIGYTLFSECPNWQETDECKLLKEHMNECSKPPSS